jgi:excisionase family DNA binding protein
MILVFLAFEVYAGVVGVGGRNSEMLTTGQAAALLGSSRQHVADLCDRGVLPCVALGKHRRIPRSAVERVVFGNPATAPELTRDQERSLWLHHAVAGKLVLDPEGVLDKARANLEHLMRVHAGGTSMPWLVRWAAVLDSGATAVLDLLTSRAELAVELRQNTPFAGMLTASERRTALATFYRHGSGGIEAARAAAA